MNTDSPQAGSPNANPPDVNPPPIRLLLVDDEAEFRESAATALSRRGFMVTEAANGNEALAAIKAVRPDVVVLDLKMPGKDGIYTLRELRCNDPDLPVIILTGHGRVEDAMAGIRLDIVDFLQKPVDLDELGTKIRRILAKGESAILRERTIDELMVLPSRYPKLFVYQPVDEVVKTLCHPFLGEENREGPAEQLRSARVYDRKGKFLGMVRFGDLIKLVLPRYLFNSIHRSFYTGMFLAQCKVIGELGLQDIMDKRITVDLKAPLIEAVDMMVQNRLVNLPVLDGEELVGILREKDLVLEIARNMAVLG